MLPSAKTMFMRTKSAFIVLIFAVTLLIASSLVQAAQNHKVRVIAHSDKEVKDAEQKG